MEKIYVLLDMLDEQKSNNKKESDIKAYLKSDFTIERIQSSDDRIYSNAMYIMNEWKAMFSFAPGRIEGIELIQRLLVKLCNNPLIDMLDIYKINEWKKIVELRGPVETILIKVCDKCFNNFYSMGMSGFIEAEGFVCNKCGDVFFKSYYDDSEIPQCICGGLYILGCPFCGENKCKTLGEISPYEYFASHNYIRRNL